MTLRKPVVSDETGDRPTTNTSEKILAEGEPSGSIVDVKMPDAIYSPKTEKI